MALSNSTGLMSLLAHRTAHGDAHRTSAPAGAVALEDYGFAGFPGNPLLASALNEARAAVLLEHRPNSLGGADDIGGKIAALPAPEDAARLVQWGPGPRAALADFELLSRVSFEPPTDGASPAILRDAGGAEIVRITRPQIALFRAQLGDVDAQAAGREGRSAEVLTQVAPPIAFYASVVNLRAHRHRRTMDLVNAAIVFANTTVMRFKHSFACPRPSDFSAAIQPLVEVPPHASFPAGHACEGQVIATVLAELIPNAAGSKLGEILRSVAFRIAENRIVAGLHFPVDNLAGRLLGDALASYFVSRCIPRIWHSGQFDAVADGDAALAKAFDGEPPFGGHACGSTASPAASVPNPLLAQLWADALQEW